METLPKFGTLHRKKGIRNTLLSLFGLMMLILAVFFYTAFLPKDLTAEQKENLRYFEYEQPRPLEDFSLTNHLGESVSVAALKGQWTLVFFGFTSCPDICPTTMGVLARLTSAMASPPQVIMVSVDPQRDTPAALKTYVLSFNPSFTGYTGKFDEIVRLARQLNMAFGKVPAKQQPDAYTVDHSVSISIINPLGEYQGFLKRPHDARNISQVMGVLMK